jgi:hypothetical protein
VRNGGSVLDNTSGHGQFAVVPEEVKKWSWAGFFLTWIWGIFNGVYISLFALIPGVNIIVSIYLGIKGNELAWKNRYWYDVEQLHKSQRKWAIAAWIISILAVAGVTGTEVDKYKEAKLTNELASKAITYIKQSENAVEFVGENFSLKYNLGRTAMISNIKTEYTSHSFMIESEKGLFHVNSELENDKEIRTIEIRNFSSNSSSDEVVTIKID